MDWVILTTSQNMKVRVFDKIKYAAAELSEY